MNSKRIIALVLAAILCVMTLVSCKGNTETPVIEEGMTATGGLSANNWACKDDEVMFTIGGQDVPFEDFRYFAMNMKTSYEGGVKGYWNEATEGKFRTDIINNFKSLIATKLLCEEKGIPFSEEDQRYLDNMLLQTEIQMTTKEYQAQLDLMYSNEKHFANLVKYDIYTEKLAKSYVTDAEVIDAVKKDYVHAKHVLISTVDDMGNPLPEDKLAEKTVLATEVYNKAIAGENFDELVKTYGEDPGMVSMPEGYYFTKNEMVPEFEEATYNLAIGAISEPVKTTYGYHIIQRLPIEDDYILSPESGFAYTVAYTTKGEQINADIKAKADSLEVVEAPAFRSFDMYTIATAK